MPMLIKSIKTSMLRIVWYQLMMITGLALIILLSKGAYQSLSAWLGSLTYWLPTLLFIWRTTKCAGAQAAMRFITAFFVGEALKLASCGVLFLIIIKFGHMAMGYALMGLIGAILAFWIASMMVLLRTKVKI